MRKKDFISWIKFDWSERQKKSNKNSATDSTISK